MRNYYYWQKFMHSAKPYLLLKARSQKRKLYFLSISTQTYNRIHFTSIKAMRPRPYILSWNNKVSKILSFISLNRSEDLISFQNNIYFDSIHYQIIFLNMCFKGNFWFPNIFHHLYKLN